jgi:hypothetical protein
MNVDFGTLRAWKKRREQLAETDMVSDENFFVIFNNPKTLK